MWPVVLHGLRTDKTLCYFSLSVHYSKTSFKLYRRKCFSLKELKRKSVECQNEIPLTPKLKKSSFSKPFTD